MKEIALADFQKLDLRVGRILCAKNLEWSDKLIKLEVDFGQLGKRQVLTGIAKWYKAEDLVGAQAIFVVNLPKKFVKNEASEAMILTAEDERDNFFLIIPERKVAEGARVC
jgi:methionine--tRNA ligase beta chain